MQRLKNRKGFWLFVEALVVITILGIVATMDTGPSAKIADDGRIKRAMTEIQTLENAISQYNLNHGAPEQIKTTTDMTTAFSKLRNAGYADVTPTFSSSEYGCTYSFYSVCDKTHIQLTGCKFSTDPIRLYTPKAMADCSPGGF